MSAQTTYFDLVKPAKTDAEAVGVLNGNMDIIDTEMHRPPLTVNGISPNPVTRNIYVQTVPLAENLASDIAQLVDGTFIQRSTGGGAPVENGEASLISIKGNLVRTGYIAEDIELTVTRQSTSNITATIDRDTFVAYVTESGTTTLTYTSSWSADPATYGITVTGTPVSGDVITVVYVKENRGTITVATPAGFKSTGWNLYDNSAGYAKVVKYSDTYGFKIGGNYSLLEFSTSVSGTRSSVTVTSGNFTIPSDGYVFVTGGDATTYIYMTWSDWTNGYSGNFQTYTEDSIDLSEVMLNFSTGLCAVGAVCDEIDLNAQKAIRRIQRLAYTAENLAAVVASGAAYIYDTNYIYAVLSSPVSTNISLDAKYNVSDHGIEFFTGTSVACAVETLYGENLKDKLRTDVVTISGGLANSLDSTATNKALTANMGKALNDKTTWKLLDTKTGTAAVDLTGIDWSEIIAYTAVNANTGIQIANHILKAYLDAETVKSFRAGYSSSASAGALVRISATLSSIYMAEASLNFADRTSGSVTTYYYR